MKFLLLANLENIVAKYLGRAFVGGERLAREEVVHKPCNLLLLLCVCLCVYIYTFYIYLYIFIERGIMPLFASNVLQFGS